MLRRSLIYSGTEGGKVEIDPCVFVTTEENQEISLVNKADYVSRVYLEDGTEVQLPSSGSIPVNYTFSNPGEHKVYIRFKDDITNFSNCFYRCTSLQSIPEGLFSNNPNVTSFYYCIYGCTSLQSIPEGLFSNSTKVTDFSYCFRNCTGLTGVTPKIQMEVSYGNVQEKMVILHRSLELHAFVAASL